MGLRDWIPPALQRKASAVQRALVLMTYGQPVWTPRDFAQLAKEGFERNITVYRSVMAIASAVSGVNWVLYSKGKGRKALTEIEQHALLDLIARPNPGQGWGEFIEAHVAYLLVAGNSYIEAVGPSETAPPMELWNLRPDRVMILPDVLNGVGGYRYTVNSLKQDFPVEQVLHNKLFSPVDDWYGLSPLAVAARAVDSDNAAMAWNVALLQNQARPSGALISKANLSDEQFATLKADVDERYSGPANAGRPLLLEGDMDWKQFSLSPADMDWLNGRKMSKLEICQAFGVPPEMIGDHEHATYSNYQEARKAFYQETVMPLLDRLRDSLNNWLTPKFGDRLFLDYDRDDIEALQEEREKVWTSSIDAVKAGVLTPNEAREKMGYETRPEGDVLLVSAMLLPLGDAIAPPPAKEAGKAFKAFNLPTPEAKAAHYKAVDNAREAWAGKFASKVRGLLDGDAKAAIAAVRADTDPAKAISARRGIWERALTATYVAVIEAFGDSTLAGLKAGTPRLEVKAFDAFDPATRAWVATTVARKVTYMQETTKDRVRDELVAGREANETVDELADRLEASFDTVSASRAQVIARTEVIGAANYGSQAAARSTGLDLLKEWIATEDGRERAEHGAMNGELVKMDEAYSNGLMFPGDPEGDAGDVIQCRCVEGYQVEEDAE